MSEVKVKVKVLVFLLLSFLIPLVRSATVSIDNQTGEGGWEIIWHVTEPYGTGYAVGFLQRQGLNIGLNADIFVPVSTYDNTLSNFHLQKNGPGGCSQTIHNVIDGKTYKVTHGGDKVIELGGQHYRPQPGDTIPSGRSVPTYLIDGVSFKCGDRFP